MLKETPKTDARSNDLKTSRSNRSFEIKKISRYRWNVLDLLTMFGRKAITSHLFCETDMTRVEQLRQKLQSEGKHTTVTAFILKAISMAQREHPESRTYFLPDSRLVVYDEIVAGFTVEREVHGEPVVFFGEIEKPCEKSVLELAAELKNYAEGDLAAVDKLNQQVMFAEMPWLLRRIILTLGEWFPPLRLKCMRATFGMSSLGSLGTTIVCGPSVCTSVFGVGTVEQRPVVSGNEIVIKPMLYIVLSYDQRGMDGSRAARFLQKVKRYLEEDIDL